MDFTPCRARRPGRAATPRGLPDAPRLNCRAGRRAVRPITSGRAFVYWGVTRMRTSPLNGKLLLYVLNVGFLSTEYWRDSLLKPSTTMNMIA